MPEKVNGTVKWFSNRKGFGFITPNGDGSSPPKEDIFVHQSNIVMEKEGTYRTLKDGMEVRFEIATDAGGKLKAQNVTSADGSPCPVPEPKERRRRNNNNRKKADADAADNAPPPDAADAVAAEAAAGTEQQQQAPTDDDGGGKGKAEGTGTNRTAADKPPPEKKGGRNRKRRNNKKGNNGENSNNNNNSNNNETTNGNSDKAKSDDGDKKPVRENMESILKPEVKKGLESKQIKIVAGKTFVAIGDARMKLGSGGYAAFGHADGLVAEGSYSFDANGQIALEWQKVLKLEGDGWELSTPAAQSDSLVTNFNLTDDNVLPSKGENDAKPIWGEGKADAREALESNNFMLRNIIFHPFPGGGRRRRNRGRRNNNAGKKEEGS